MSLFACRCCGYKTLSEEPTGGTYEICPVCFWEDDEAGLDSHPDSISGANGVSLLKAQHNFVAFGASKKADREHVRPPKPDEERPEGWHYDWDPKYALVDLQMPRRIILDGRTITTEDDFYNQIIPALRFPDWCGHNLDAINDLLVDGTDPVELIWQHSAISQSALGERVWADIEEVFSEVKEAKMWFDYSFE